MSSCSTKVLVSLSPGKGVRASETTENLFWLINLQFLWETCPSSACLMMHVRETLVFQPSFSTDHGCCVVSRESSVWRGRSASGGRCPAGRPCRWRSGARSLSPGAVPSQVWRANGPPWSRSESRWERSSRRTLLRFHWSNVARFSSQKSFSFFLNFK